MNTPPALGVSGRIAAFFQAARITPLLALVALLLGVFAVLVTPREEEPQIDVTMAVVRVAYPGASVPDVEQRVAIPVERWLSGMQGVEHVVAVSHPGMALVTVQFKVGVPRSEALVRLQDALDSRSVQLPPGASAPLVQAKGIDDVPIVAYSLHSRDPDAGPATLERVARSIESELARVPGVREVRTLGAPGRAITVELDPGRLASVGLDTMALRRALEGLHASAPLGDRVQGNRAIALEAGPWLTGARDVESLIVGVHAGKPVTLSEVARVIDGPLPPARSVWHTEAGGATHPALTLAVTKKAGENAIDVADALSARVESLKNAVVPDDVVLTLTRNYGATANDKARQLMSKLLLATASVVALVFVALGRREAAIVGIAVVLTLAATLFASWVWGFTLNRVSLFALVFSIGILVDDAIVVVENIHRHQQLYPGRRLVDLIPGAVDEVGGPTILATLAVIAALLPMAFVSGLMGPYMAPIPINASMGMLLSLAIAFVLTPWLARLWLKPVPEGQAQDPDALHGLSRRLAPVAERVFAPLLDEQRGPRARRWLGLGVAGLIALSLLLPATGLVVLKMLPFDNKSEFQVVVDMPAGTPLERTAAVLGELSQHLAGVPEVAHIQAYAGTAAPINFNGLVRQYDLRVEPHQGDLQVNLVPKGERKEKSHVTATRLRPALQAIGQRHGANVKVVEVPPGPPVLSPLVAEIYGPDPETRRTAAQQVRQVLEKGRGIVDVDDSGIADAPRQLLVVDRRKAAQLGVSVPAIVDSLRTAQAGDEVLWLMDGQSSLPLPLRLQLPAAERGSLDSLLALKLRAGDGRLVPLRELVTVVDSLREQPRYRKDGLGVHFVVADVAGAVDSPLYGLFGVRSALAELTMPDGGRLHEYFIRQPADPYRGTSLKWDGEWQITYETFRDMGLAYGVGLVLIYFLVVAQFGSYLTPLVIMAPIPLTVIGVMPGHALLGAPFTATSMIGMIALAGIIVRNSILLVDFINLQLRAGLPFERAIVRAVVARAQPIGLTALAAMAGAFFILDDPIFNGLAISLIFGIAVSTVLTLVVIPVLYHVAYRHRLSFLKE